MADFISINEAAARGCALLRKPEWVSECDHLKVDIIDGGKPGPWTHLYAPFNKQCNGRDPVDVLCVSMDYDEQCWFPHTGPTHDSDEYKAQVARFDGFSEEGR